jgi:ferritin-like metal-binding protein YciE
MKTITTLDEALALELENLRRSEKRLIEQLPKIEQLIQSKQLRNTIVRYKESCDPKILKIDRVLSYLHREPGFCHTDTIDELIHESLDRLKFAQDPEVQEQMLINCIERIITYKTCVYEASLRYAEELELDVAADLLVEIIQWERKIKKELTELSFHEFSKERHLVLN